MEAEGGGGAGVLVLRGGDGERAAELVEIVLVGEVRVLVEPFGGEKLGGPADGLAAVAHLDGGPDEGLRCLGQGDDAEAERHAQLHRALEEADLG
jgi:hypothetical protein